MLAKGLRFTIAISAYNIKDYIGRAIQSVLSQDFENYEILIVDDCSTDGTLEEIKKYENEKMRILKTPKNSGTAGGTRNLAIDNAKGQYIIFLDGDDTLYDNQTLRKADEAIGEDLPEIVFCGYQDVDQEKKERISTKENSTKKARLLCDLTFSVSSRCWNREFLNKNNMRFVEGMYYEDEVFCLKGTILANNTKASEIKLFKYYRNRAGSVMSSPSIKKCSDWYRMLAEVMDLYNITPNEYKPYLLSFIKNETESLPKRVGAILIAKKEGGKIKLLPKRNYKYKEMLGNENEVVCS